jgi:hypothetical protein
MVAHTDVCLETLHLMTTQRSGPSSASRCCCMKLQKLHVVAYAALSALSVHWNSTELCACRFAEGARGQNRSSAHAAPACVAPVMGHRRSGGAHGRVHAQQVRCHSWRTHFLRDSGTCGSAVRAGLPPCANGITARERNRSTRRPGVAHSELPYIVACYIVACTLDGWKDSQKFTPTAFVLW